MLTQEDASAGLRLSRLANWNQTLPDWRCLLQAGEGSGMKTADGLLVASMIALPLGPQHGWISMVLTDPEWRRQGLARQLMQVGIERLETQGLLPTLDATPAGEAVYRTMDFSGSTQLARWIVSPDTAAVASDDPYQLAPRQILEADLDRLDAWDLEHSGCNRSNILRFLRGNFPEMALVVETASGEIQGYVMGRLGERRPQIGPLMAVDAAVAGLLLRTASKVLQGPFYVDAFANNQASLTKGFAANWSRERGFKRLSKGSGACPENPETAYLAAGPEFS